MRISADLNINYPFGMPPEDADVLWRIRAQRYSYTVDPDRDEYATTDPRLEAVWHYVLRRTPCGAWIGIDADTARFVRLNTPGQRFAYNTVGDALDGLIARRRRQLGILASRVRRTQEDLDLAEAVRARRAQP